MRFGPRAENKPVPNTSRIRVSVTWISMPREFSVPSRKLADEYVQPGDSSIVGRGPHGIAVREHCDGGKPLSNCQPLMRIEVRVL